METEITSQAASLGVPDDQLVVRYPRDPSVSLSSLPVVERLLRRFRRPRHLGTKKKQAATSSCPRGVRPKLGGYKLYQVNWLARKARWRSLKSAARLAS